MRIISVSRLFALSLLLVFFSCAGVAMADDFLYDVDQGQGVLITDTAPALPEGSALQEQAMSIVDQVVEDVIKPGMDDFDKAVALHDWLCDHATYDSTDKQHSGYDMLVHGTGTDQAYVEAYSLLLSAVGIESTWDESTDHRWNVVKLNGEWCHVDCRWDDQGTADHTFFGLPDEIMHAIRGHENGHFTGAKTYRLNYAYRTGVLDAFIAAISEQIQQELSSLSSSFVMEMRPADNTYHVGARITIMVLSEIPFTFGGEQVYLSFVYDEFPEVPYRNCTVSVNGCQHQNHEIRGALEVTCAAEGYTGDLWCLDCEKCIQAGQAITELLPHTPHSTGSVPPTDTESGLTEGYICAVCGLVLAEQEIIPAEKKATLIQDEDGKWRLYENDEFSERSGIISFQGGQFHVIQGVLASDENGLVLVDGKWVFVSAGQVQTQYTGLAQYDGEWFYITGGLLNTSTNGLVDYDGSRFLVAAGRILYSVNGLWQNAGEHIVGADGLWYFLANGQVQTQYAGLSLYDGHWFYLRNGLLAVDYTGPVPYGDSVFEVVSGMVIDD